MPLYSYRVRSRDGQTFDGTIDATSESDAATKLRAQGFIITQLERNRDILANARREHQASGRVTLKDLAIFSRQLATLINAGVAILVSLRVLQKQTSSRKLRSIIGELCIDLEGGASLATALRKHQLVFPEIMINTIAAGEVSGALDEVLNRVADHFEKEYEMNQKIKTAMFYPSLVLIMSVLVVIFLVTVVLPNFVSMFESMGATLPLPTRILIEVGSFMRRFWYIVLGSVVGSVAAFRWWGRTDQGRHTLDSLKLRLPVFGPLILGTTISRFARTMATLSQSGVPILVTLGVLQKVVDNVLIADALQSAEASIRAGQSLTSPLVNSGVFPPIVTQMISVGEETGQLDSLLEKVAEFYDREVKAIVERLGSMLEPLMIGILGLIVGGIAIAVVMPMFQQFGIVFR